MEMAGPVAVRPGRLTDSAARTNVALFIHRAVRPLTPPDIETPLRAVGVKSRLGARGWTGENTAQTGATRQSMVGGEAAEEVWRDIMIFDI